MRRFTHLLAALLLAGGSVAVGVGPSAEAAAPGPAPAVATFGFVHFLNQRVGWAITPHGIAESRDGGRLWRWSVHLPARDGLGTARAQVAERQGAVWVPVAVRAGRSEIWRWAPGEPVHRMRSPVAASAIAAMHWTSLTTGFLLAAPQGVSEESEEVQLWTTTDGGASWRELAAPPFAGVKGALTLGGQPAALWIGGFRPVPCGSPLYQGVIEGGAVTWRAPRVPIPAGLIHDYRAAVAGLRWWSPSQATLWVGYWNANSQHGPLVLYRTRDGGARWTIGSVLGEVRPGAGVTTADVGATAWVGIPTAPTTTWGLPHTTRIWAVGRASHPTRVGAVPGLVTTLDGVPGTLWALSRVGRHHQVLWVSRTGGRTWRRA